jgi:hypothetical protein
MRYGFGRCLPFETQHGNLTFHPFISINQQPHAAFFLAGGGNVKSGSMQ